MTNPLHDAAMAAKRFHDAALAELNGADGGTTYRARQRGREVTTDQRYSELRSALDTWEEAREWEAWNRV